MSFREEQYYASSKESFIKLEKDFKSHEENSFLSFVIAFGFVKTNAVSSSVKIEVPCAILILP